MQGVKTFFLWLYRVYNLQEFFLEKTVLQFKQKSDNFYSHISNQCIVIGNTSKHPLECPQKSNESIIHYF